MTLMQWLRGTPPQPNPHVEEARQGQANAMAQAGALRRELAIALAQVEELRADPDTAAGQLEQAWKERDDALGQSSYFKGLLAALREDHEETRRERDRAVRERIEARQDLAARTYRQGGAAQPQSALAQILAERARADQLAELVDRLQTANMAMDRPRR